jgi:hypothetical protein
MADQTAAAAAVAVSDTGSTDTRLAQIRALGEAALANHGNDAAYLDGIILQLGDNDIGIAMIRGLVESVKTGVLSQQQATAALTAMTEPAKKQAVETPAATIAGAIAATEGGQSVAMAGAAAGTERPATIPFDPKQREAEALARLGLEQKPDSGKSLAG